MSRNFELLQKAGWGQEHFSLPFQPVPSEPAAPPTPGENKKPETKERESRDPVARLVRRVFLMPKKKAPRVVAFSGSIPSIGASWVCGRAGQILSEHSGERVCLLDANLQSPRLHRCFRQPNVAGVWDAIRSRRPVSSFANRLDQGGLWLVSAGRAPSNMRASAVYRTLAEQLDALRSEFGFVLIEVPPLQDFPQLATLGKGCEGLILVLDPCGTPLEEALGTRRRAEAAGTPLLGAVLFRQSDGVSDFLSRLLK